MTLLEELDFLHEVCFTVLLSSRVVKFAAVLDNNGKLLVGEYRKGSYSWRTDFVSDDNNNYHHDPSYLFYLDYVVPAIKKRKLSCACYEEEEEQQGQEQEFIFEITEIGENVGLAIVPLTERMNKFLCIYLESSSPYQEIISKLNNAIM